MQEASLLDTAMTSQLPRVALVNMPFASTRSPSIQLGLLQAEVCREGFSCSAFYFNLDLAAQVGWDRYEVLCSDRTLLLGEWLFSRAAFGAAAPDGEEYLERFAEELAEPLDAIGQDAPFLLTLREEVLPTFIESCAARVHQGCFDVVGLSSIFEQNCAALALARRVKELDERLVTVFGGANFEDEMGLEYVRTLPWVDYAVIGEGDVVFPHLLRELGLGGDAGDVPGVASRGADGTIRFTGRAAPVTDLDSLPEPDYGPYFAAASALEMPARVRNKAISLPFETARGCWWGAKHHCTFCGLNGLGMGFRSKSVGRAISGLDELASQYAIYQMVAVDNIMDLAYVKGMFGELADRRCDYTFFYETKANLTHQQLEQLARGGVRHLQPGIESLSTHVLQLMRKGTTALQNVRLLKWGRYYEINLHWNVLFGFPGECPEDYQRQLEIMRLIPHLEPPESVGRIWLERFSPNFAERDQLGIRDVEPEPTYRHVYPANIDLARIAYFFAYRAESVVPPRQHSDLFAHVNEWKAVWEGDQVPYLVYQRGAGRLTVTDGRDPREPQMHSFGEHGALVYEFCTPTAHSASRIRDHLASRTGAAVSADSVDKVLVEFVSLGLMLEEDGHYLSLALPVNQNW